MRRTSSRSLRRGASAIEFALCLPIFCAIVFGIIEYGWVFFQQANVIAAVREGARLGVTLPRTSDPEGTAIAEVRNTLRGVGYTSAQVDAATVTATVTDSTANGAPSDAMTVVARVPYQQIIGMIPVPPEIHAEMTMMMEFQD